MTLTGSTLTCETRRGEGPYTRETGLSVDTARRGHGVRGRGQEDDCLERGPAVEVQREEALEIYGAHAHGHVVTEACEGVGEEVCRGGDSDGVEVELGGKGVELDGVARGEGDEEGVHRAGGCDVRLWGEPVAWHVGNGGDEDVKAWTVCSGGEAVDHVKEDVEDRRGFGNGDKFIPESRVGKRSVEEGFKG